jgi:hypothetical protein
VSEVKPIMSPGTCQSVSLSVSETDYAFTFLAGYGNGEEFVGTDGSAGCCKEFWEGFDLVDFGRVGDLLVVGAVAAWVFPVDIYNHWHYT